MKQASAITFAKRAEIKFWRITCSADAQNQVQPRIFCMNHVTGSLLTPFMDPKVKANGNIFSKTL